MCAAGEASRGVVAALSVACPVLCHFVLLLAVVTAFPVGIPTSSCSSMAPQHGCSASQASGGPTLELLPMEDGATLPLTHYRPDELHYVRLVAGDAPITGFILSSFTGGTWQGSWRAPFPPGAKVMGAGVDAATGVSCGVDRTASHTSRDDRSEVVLRWQAPPSGTGRVVVRGAAVISYQASGECVWYSVSLPLEEAIPVPVVVASDGVSIPVGATAVVVTGEFLGDITDVSLWADSGNRWEPLPRPTSYVVESSTRLTLVTQPLHASLAGKALAVILERAATTVSGGGAPTIVGTIEDLDMQVTATPTRLVGVGATTITVEGSGFPPEVNASITAGSGASLVVERTMIYGHSTLSIVVGALGPELVDETLVVVVLAYAYSSVAVPVGTVTDRATILYTAHTASVSVGDIRLVIEGGAFVVGASARMTTAQGESVEVLSTEVVSSGIAHVTLTQPIPFSKVGAVVEGVIINPSGVQSNAGLPVGVATVRAIPALHVNAGAIATDAAQLRVTGSGFGSPLQLRIFASVDGAETSVGDVEIGGVEILSGTEAVVTPVAGALQQFSPGVALFAADLVAFGTVAQDPGAGAVLVATLRQRPEIHPTGELVAVGATQLHLAGRGFEQGSTVAVSTDVAGVDVDVLSVEWVDEAHLVVEVGALHPLLDGHALNTVVTSYGIRSDVATATFRVRRRPVVTLTHSAVPGGVRTVEILGEFSTATEGGQGVTSSAELRTHSGAVESLGVASSAVLANGRALGLSFATPLDAAVGAELVVVVCIDGLCSDPSGTPVATVADRPPGHMALRDGWLDLYWFRSWGSLWLRLELQRDGWVGLGVSSSGTMVGPPAVSAAIALPDDGVVASYRLREQRVNGVTADSTIPLQDGTVSQTDGVTIAEFSRPLGAVTEDEQSISPTEATPLVWAYGALNPLSYHMHRGVAEIHLSCTPEASCSGHGVCEPGGTTCVCDAGYTRDDCSACRHGFARARLQHGCVASFADAHLKLLVEDVADNDEVTISDVLEDLELDVSAALAHGVSVSVVQFRRESSVLLAAVRLTASSTATDEADVVPFVRVLRELVSQGPESRNALYDGAVGHRLVDEADPPLSIGIPLPLARPQSATSFQLALSATLTMQWYLRGDVVDVQLVYEGLGWLGFAVSRSDAAEMIGSDAVIALPSTTSPGSVLQYDLTSKFVDGALPAEAQDILDPVVLQEAGRTEMRFSRLLTPIHAPGVAISTSQGTTMLWAVGAGNSLDQHIEWGSAVVNFGSGAVEEQDLSAISPWSAVHGISMYLACVVIMPMGALVAQRRAAVQVAMKSWLWCHAATQLSAATVAALGFVAAIVSAGGFNGQHLKFPLHAGLGIATLCCIASQLACAVRRPAAAPSGNHDRRTRNRWELCHRIGALAIAALGVGAILTGLLGTIPLGAPLRWVAMAVMVIAVAVACWSIDRKRRCTAAKVGAAQPHSSGGGDEAERVIEVG